EQARRELAGERRPGGGEASRDHARAMDATPEGNRRATRARGVGGGNGNPGQPALHTGRVRVTNRRPRVGGRRGIAALAVIGRVRASRPEALVLDEAAGGRVTLGGADARPADLIDARSPS